MSLKIRYMGAKHDLAPTVSDIISEMPAGPCLDLFSGMCSVAGSVAESGRTTWCNDVQSYANLVAEVMVTTGCNTPDIHEAISTLRPHFQKNYAKLADRFDNELQKEENALTNTNDHKPYANLVNDRKNIQIDEDLKNEAKDLSRNPSKFPYRLMSITFPHTYFGLRQTIEIDSLRYAIEYSRKEEIITEYTAKWCLVGLLQSASHVVSAPGHFAQYLTVKDDTYTRIRRQRKRSVWGEYYDQLSSIQPYGSATWRRQNQSYCLPATKLLSKLDQSSNKPSVIYADPPYSKAQYSRYYHVLETITKYDYPNVKHKGQYREDRFFTPFSRVGEVKCAFEHIVEQSSNIGAELVLTYPSNGILYKSGANLKDILDKEYDSVEIYNLSNRHSTMGGSPGRAKSDVNEKIYKCW